MYLVIAGKHVIECGSEAEAMKVYRTHACKCQSYRVRMVKVVRGE